MDGLIYASSMVVLDSARRHTPVPALARWLLGLGIAATLAANVAHGLGDGPIGAAVAAWPAVALIGSYELLMLVIRSSQISTDGSSGAEHEVDPLEAAAAKAFPSGLRLTWFPRSVPFLLSFMSASHVHSGYAIILLRAKTPGQDPPPNRTINLRDFVRGAGFPPTL
jgi:hypothetical protein